MAKKPANKKAVSVPTFSLGDRVEIIHFARGTIAELRGPLGPDGAQVYRVLYRRKPKAGYIEVLGSQLRPAKNLKRARSNGRKLPPAAGVSGAMGASVGE
jgi:hypothetical protein